MFGSTSSSTTISPSKSAAACRRRVGVVEDDDPFVLVGDAQLEVGHAHRVVRDAAECLRFQRLMTFRLLRCLVFFVDEVPAAAQAQDRPSCPLCADGDVRRAGHDRLRLGRAVVELHELELVGVRVLVDLQHLRDDDLVAVPDRAGRVVSP